MRKLLVLVFILSFFILSIKAAYADTTVSVTENSVYNVTGENYIVEIGKTTTKTGTEQGIYIDNLKFPGVAARNFEFTNSSYNTSTEIQVDLTSLKTNSSIIENNPTRVIIRFENKTSNACGSSPEVVCWNWTVDYYFYPRKYFVKYYIEGNFTGLKVKHYAFNPLVFEKISTSLPNNFTYYGSVQNLQGTLTESGTIFPSGYYFFPIWSGINESYIFVWNETHSKTVATAGTFSEFLKNNPHFGIENGQNITQMYIRTALNTFYNTTNVSFGWMNWFGNSGSGGLELNHTVNDELNDTYLDFHYPASVTMINGTYQQRDNITGTYNFTVDSNGLLRFNFSTGSYTRTYPVFHIKDATPASSYKDHIWYKNYSQSNTWQQLTNYTDFVIQDGNSTYFGYNYILLLINKTLGSDYDFWIDDNSDPPLINVTTNQSSYTPGQTVLAHGTFYFGNGSGISNKNVTVTFKSPTGSTLQQRNVTTNSNGEYNDTYSLPSTATGGTYTVDVKGYYDSLTAEDSTTFNVFITTLTASPITIKTYPEEILPVVSISKLLALRNLTYEEVVRTLGTEYKFRIEISEE